MRLDKAHGLHCYFNIAFESLARALRVNNCIGGVNINYIEAKIALYADDPLQSMEVLLDLVKKCVW